MFCGNEIRCVQFAYDVSDRIKHMPFAFTHIEIFTFQQSSLEHITCPFLLLHFILALCSTPY